MAKIDLAGHSLKYSVTQNRADCACGRWTLTSISKPLTKQVAQKNFFLHLDLVR